MKCMVLFCENKGNVHGLTYFMLTSKRHDSWMRALGRDPTKEHLSDKNCVCEVHFRKENKFVVNNKTKLRPDAIPQLNLKKSSVPNIQVEQRSSRCSNVLSSISANRNVNIHAVELQDEIIINPMQFHSAQENFPDILDEDKENIVTSIVSGPIDEISSLLERSPSSTITLDSLPESTSSDPSQESTSSDPTFANRFKRKLANMTSSSDSDGFKGAVKRSRRDIKMFHNYSASPRDILSKLKKTNHLKNVAQKKLKVCKKRVSRLKKKVSSLKQIVHDLRNKRLLSEDALTVLERSYSGMPLSLMRRAIENMKNEKLGKKQRRSKIPDEIRSFAMTLQFYSSKAYAYVRQIFNLALPAPSTIRGWLSNVDCEPGFCQSAFNSLAIIVNENNKLNKKTICALMLDEMAIKKQIEVKGNKTWGYENLGADISDASSKYATEALVLMVVSLNSGWKLPIAYFLINSLSGAEKANIVRESLKKLFEIGVIITSVTCDGPNAHFTMAEELGAKVTRIGNLQPSFKHLMNDSKVHIIFDACHMIKLVRNNWAKCRIFLNSRNEEISFHYIEELHSLQEDEFCRFGNKLRRSHLEWEKQKMKVNLAVQTISSSVADALEFLMVDIQDPRFAGAGATIEFIRIIDRAFDLLNTRNPFGKGYKTPMKLENENIWRPLLEDTIQYLKSLKHVNGTAIHSSKNKTPILGLCTTIKSVLAIFNEYVKKPNSPLTYILTYKFSQDHLELFFCCIKGRNGWNNNPTAYQFYYTFKRLTLKHDIQNLQGNCVNLDSTNILTTTQRKTKIFADFNLDDMTLIKKYDIDVNDMLIEDTEFYHIISNLPLLSSLTENVVTYISGFVVKSIKKIIKCRVCLSVTEELDEYSMDAENFKLLNRKNRGGLIKPSKDLTDTCIFLEKKIRQVLAITNNSMPTENNFMETFIHHICTHLFQDENLFSAISDHVFDISPYEVNHKLKMIRAIVRIYSRIRFFNVSMLLWHKLRK